MTCAGRAPRTRHFFSGISGRGCEYIPAREYNIALFSIIPSACPLQAHVPTQSKLNLKDHIGAFGIRLHPLAGIEFR